MTLFDLRAPRSKAALSGQLGAILGDRHGRSSCNRVVVLICVFIFGIFAWTELHAHGVEFSPNMRSADNPKLVFIKYGTGKNDVVREIGTLENCPKIAVGCSIPYRRFDRTSCLECSHIFSRLLSEFFHKHFAQVVASAAYYEAHADDFGSATADIGNDELRMKKVSWVSPEPIISEPIISEPVISDPHPLDFNGSDDQPGPMDPQIGFSSNPSLPVGNHCLPVGNAGLEPNCDKREHTHHQTHGLSPWAFALLFAGVPGVVSLIVFEWRERRKDKWMQRTEYKDGTY